MMLEHIVKNGENIDDIINVYKVSLEELQINNLHITDYNNIIPGTILKIPLITEEIEQILDKTESFVMDYYPKISKEISNEKKEEKIEIRGKAYPGIIPPKYNKRITKWENQ